MNKINYDLLMRQTMESMKERKKLLLHACCAPCASGCVERLLPFFDTTLYFYNPNMENVAEYDKRATELVRLAEYFSLPYYIVDFHPEEYLSVIKGWETEPERGKRCHLCYRLRLENTALFARENGFDAFATTLTLSPLKSADTLNQIGLEIGEQNDISYLVSDFKKGGGNLRSKELSEKLSLYRQNYCGCIFSK